MAIRYAFNYLLFRDKSLLTNCLQLWDGVAFTMAWVQIVASSSACTDSNISKAARAVHITQSGLSQRLCRLEARLGCELFDRSTSPLRPTASGEVFIRYAFRAIAAEDNMRRDVREAG